MLPMRKMAKAYFGYRLVRHFMSGRRRTTTMDRPMPPMSHL